MGDDYLLPSIAAVVVGGGLITGGRGHYLGMLAGVLLLTALQTLLAGSNLPYATRAILYGLVVLGAVIAASGAPSDSDRAALRGRHQAARAAEKSSMANVAIIGAGLIGRAWALVYARGGHRVRLWDSQPAQVGQALAFAREVAPGLAQAGLLRGRTVDQLLAALEPVGRMEDALRDADYVQESTPERWTASVASMPNWIAWRRLARSWPARPRRCCLRISRPTCLAARVAWWRIRSIHRIWSGRGNRAGALDRRRLRRARAQPAGRGRPAAHRDAARDRRLRRQPAAGRAAARGVPAGGRWLRRRRGRGHLHPRRFGAALGLHGPVRDHRPERPAGVRDTPNATKACTPRCSSP